MGPGAGGRSSSLPWGALEVGRTSSGAQRLRRGTAVAPGSRGAGAVGTDVLLSRNEPRVRGPRRPPGGGWKRSALGAPGARPAPCALAPGPRSAAPRAQRVAGWSRAGAGKLRSTPGVPAATGPEPNLAAASLGFPDSAPQRLQLTRFISAPCTKAPDLKGKSGNWPPSRGCWFQRLVNTTAVSGAWKPRRRPAERAARMPSRPGGCPAGSTPVRAPSCPPERVAGRTPRQASWRWVL